MSLMKLIGRCAETAVKLPVAAAWDFVSLGNIGYGASTAKVIRDHQEKKRCDEIEEVIDQLLRMMK